MDIYEARRIALLSLLNGPRFMGVQKLMAEEAKVSRSYLTRMLKPEGDDRKRIGEEMARKLEANLDLLADSLVSPSSHTHLIKNDETDHAPLVAHGLSLDIHTVPPTIKWGDLMELERSRKLPAAFRLVMKDNAMAPIAGAGATVEFGTSREGQVGDAVLVRDAQGRHYFREMCELADGWEARPTNQAFARLNSRDHGLTVIAVFAGVARVGSWSELAR